MSPIAFLFHLSVIVCLCMCVHGVHARVWVRCMGVIVCMWRSEDSLRFYLLPCLRYGRSLIVSPCTHQGSCTVSFRAPSSLLSMPPSCLWSVGIADALCHAQPDVGALPLIYLPSSTNYFPTFINIAFSFSLLSWFFMVTYFFVCPEWAHLSWVCNYCICCWLP